MDSADRKLSRCAERQHGLVTRAQALAAGFSERAIDYRIRERTWERLHPSVYLLAGSPRSYPQVVLGAVLAAGEPVVVSGRTAGMLWNLPVKSNGIELTVPRSRCPRVTGADIHRRAVMPPAVNRLGIPVTNVEWTIAGLSAVVCRSELGTLIDYALGHRALSLPRLELAARQVGSRGRKGTSDLRDLIAERRGHKSTTFIENRFRQAMQARGLPVPEEQYLLSLPNGKVAIIDFAWARWRLAVGIDGFTNHSSMTDWMHDHIRNQWIIAAGWLPLDVPSLQLQEDPEGVADLVIATLEAVEGGKFARPMGEL